MRHKTKIIPSKRERESERVYHDVDEMSDEEEEETASHDSEADAVREFKTKKLAEALLALQKATMVEEEVFLGAIAMILEANTSEQGSQ